MNKIGDFVPRKRSQNLLIVEGNHEKNILFRQLFKCFPELNIDMDDIWIYGTNIYVLYNDIVKEYGEDWNVEDVDLPFVISKKQYLNQRRYKDDFVNIILVFDYERHDPNFSEEKIMILQEYFNDMANVGQLYINYPMIESYQDIECIPDDNYIDKKVSVTINPGRKYKALVNNSPIKKIIELPEKMIEILIEKLFVSEDDGEVCVKELLNLSSDESLKQEIGKELEVISKKNIITVQFQFEDLIRKLNYINRNISYWAYLREVFQDLIKMNLKKAVRIQNSPLKNFNNYRDLYNALDLTDVLKQQNSMSSDFKNGYIWILNTCLFIVVDYNMNLLINDSKL